MRRLVERPNAPLPAAAKAASARAFTLIDVLISLAVVVVLISLMLPSLGRVRETAHQVICRSNVRQIGIGISLYVEDHTGRLMSSINAGAASGSNKPWETVQLRIAQPYPAAAPTGWDGLGLLFSADYLPAPKLYYCPSHRGRNGFWKYEDAWAGRNDDPIGGNYQYRGRGPSGVRHAGQPAPPPTVFLPDMMPGAAIVADSMRSQQDFNHRIGSNVLRADNSVDWFSDVGGRIGALLPRDGEMPEPGSFEHLWRNLDGEDG